LTTILLANFTPGATRFHALKAGPAVRKSRPRSDVKVQGRNAGQDGAADSPILPWHGAGLDAASNPPAKAASWSRRETATTRAPRPNAFRYDPPARGVEFCCVCLRV